MLSIHNERVGMGHPDGGRGNIFNTNNTFQDAFEFIGLAGITFTSTTGEIITASRGRSRFGNIPTITFRGINCTHGNVCSACWGYRQNCSGSYIGQCTEALDNSF